VERSRKAAVDVINQIDDRLLVIVGPHSIKDMDAQIAYGKKLARISAALKKDICLVMRCNFENPETLRRCKAIVNDTNGESSDKINRGLRLSRRCLVELTGMGLPVATEMLGVMSRHFLVDLMSVCIIGSANVHSKVHQEWASSIPVPMGFHISNSEDHVKDALEAMHEAGKEHHFITFTPEGRCAIASTRGNGDCFAVVDASSKHFLQQCKKVHNSAKETKRAAWMVAYPTERTRDNANHNVATQEVCEQVSTGDHTLIGTMMHTDIEDDMQWEALILSLGALANAVRQRRNTTKTAQSNITEGS
jgi:3-deoxy-7-phosphoheptulonate synthase